MRLVEESGDSQRGREFVVQFVKNDLDPPTNAFMDFVGSLGERTLVDGVKLGAFKSEVEELYSS